MYIYISGFFYSLDLRDIRINLLEKFFIKAIFIKILTSPDIIRIIILCYWFD